MKINLDYFNVFKEPALFAALIARHAFTRKTAPKSNAVLIVNPCLIGEFAASAPALYEFTRKHKGTEIDLLVSPMLKSLAQHITGVRAVYTAQSVFAREYKKVIVLRISSDAYRILGAIKTARVQTALPHFIRYGIHLIWNLFRGKAPKSWREVSFAILNEVPRDMPFDDIFSISSEEYARVLALPALQAGREKVVIHTGASWPMMRWEKERWIELLQRINALGLFEFIFVGAERDIEDYEYISSRLKFKTYSVISQINLFELVLLLRSADYFIGIDSGPANMAHLADLQSVTILGPGPHMFMPSNANDIVVDKSNGRGIYQRFFLKKNGFMQKITVDEVYQSFYNMLNKL